MGKPLYGHTRNCYTNRFSLPEGAKWVTLSLDIEVSRSHFVMYSQKTTLRECYWAVSGMNSATLSSSAAYKSGGTTWTRVRSSARTPCFSLYFAQRSTCIRLRQTRGFTPSYGPISRRTVSRIALHTTWGCRTLGDRP